MIVDAEREVFLCVTLTCRAEQIMELYVRLVLYVLNVIAKTQSAANELRCKSVAVESCSTIEHTGMKSANVAAVVILA